MFYLMILLVLVLAVMALSLVLGVPFMPTHRAQTETMMDLLAVGPGTQLVDLGSGAGRLLFAAARRGAIATGYELNPVLFVWTMAMIWLKGYSGRVTVRWQSLYAADVSQADVVAMFLFPQFMAPLEKKLFSECPPGAVIASYTFAFPNTKADLKKEGIYVYRVPRKPLTF